MQKSAGKKEQNEIAHNYLKGSDLVEREQEVLEDASKRTGFVPSKLVGRSTWWGSKEIGAFHYEGEFEGKRAVLKVQGVKPAVSEIYMINSFETANKSKLIRPPYLYSSLDWDEERRYEALVLEFVDGPRVVQTPTNSKEVKKFFDVYEDYRANCLQEPWIEKPNGSISTGIVRSFERWRETSLRIYPNHQFRKEEDASLVDEAVKVLEKGYQGVAPEFVHGHFSEGDLYKVGDQVVVLSNLYWSWRQPLYDAIFGYHWFMYHLNVVDGITPQEVEEQRRLWMDRIESLPQTQGAENRKLLNLALLERAAAGLNLDSLSADPEKPITEYLMESTRNNIKSLIKTLSY